MYQYNAVVLNNYDADTLRVNIDLGLGVWAFNQAIRVYGIDAYELKTAKGKLARDRVSALIPAGTKIVINTIKDSKEKYGRYLAKIIIPDGRNLATILVYEELAVAYFGGTKTITE